MKNIDNIFPDVPDVFHNSLENALQNIQIQHKGKAKNKKTRLILILAAVLLVGTITVGASEIFKWNEMVAEGFQIEEEDQEILTIQGAASEANAEYTQNGLTVKALQTLQDGHNLYVALEVTAPKDIILTDTNVFDIADIKVEGIQFGQNGSASITNNFMTILPDETNTNQRIYEFLYYESEGFDLNGKTITVTLSNLMEDKGKQEYETVLEGEWQLSWVNRSQDTTQHIELNQQYNFSEYDVMVKSIDISPLSMSVAYDGKQIQEMEQRENVRLDQLEVLQPIRFHGFRLKDGSILEANSSAGYSFNEDYSEYSGTEIFHVMVPLQNVKSLLFGSFEGPYTEITLGSQIQ